MGSDAPNPELEQAIIEWRTRHRLQADDPILLVVELLDRYTRHHLSPAGTSGGAESRRGVDGWAAAVAVVLAAIGGFILGRVWT